MVARVDYFFKEEMMKQKGPLYIHGPVHIFNPIPEFDILIKDLHEEPVIPTSSDIDPKLNLEGLKRVADIFIFQKNRNPYDPEYQVDDFKGSIITLVVDIPDSIRKEFVPSTLKLLYYDKHKKLWVILNSVAVVSLKSWIKDPPLGWGGDHPH